MKNFSRFVMITVEMFHHSLLKSIKIKYEIHINHHHMYILTGVGVNQNL